MKSRVSEHARRAGAMSEANPARVRSRAVTRALLHNER